MEAYFDNSATTAPCIEAIRAVNEALTDCWGNPSSLHRTGNKAKELLDLSRESIAKRLSCDPSEIFFTSGGTESNNLAVMGAAYQMRRFGKRIVSTSVEHPSIDETLNKLEAEGFEVIKLRVDNFGRVNERELYAAVNSNTILITMMLVNNELGTVQPVAEAARLVKRIRPDILVHTDAVQAYRKMPVNVRTLGVDLLSLSGHKIHAYKGIGALYVRKGVRLAPVIYGGGQEKGIAPGTEPVPLIAALAAAASQPLAAETLNRLKDRVLSAVAEQCPQAEVLSAGEAGGICAITLRGFRGETVMHALEERGFYVSTGSACGKGKPSHVYAALPVDEAAKTGALRISVSQDTDPADIDRFAQALAEAAAALTPKRKRAI